MAQITLNSTGVASSGALVLQSNGTTTAVTIDTSQRAAFVAGTALLPAITTTGDTNTGIWFPAADTIAFTEGGVESMRISSGNLLLGQTTNGASAKIGILTGNGSNGISVTNTSGTALYNAMVFYVNGSTYTNTGAIAVSGSSTAYNTSSDYRLKEDIAPMTGALAKVALLKPCTYKWKVNGLDGQGFIAHELAEVVLGCVTGKKDAVDAEGKPQYQGIDTSFLVATLTAAIQEQQALITSLTARITALEST